MESLQFTKSIDGVQRLSVTVVVRARLDVETLAKIWLADDNLYIDGVPTSRSAFDTFVRKELRERGSHWPEEVQLWWDDHALSHVENNPEEIEQHKRRLAQTIAVLRGFYGLKEERARE